MSHSNFKIIANDEPISHNLVILVNKNGSIGTDTATLQNLLTSKETPQTGVTVIRETSPTPSIEEEIEVERLEQLNMLRRQLRVEHPSADEDEIEEHLKKISGISDSVPHVTLSVENYFPPNQARKFANDVLHLGGVDNIQTLMPIDFNFRRKIIENDHCYTPLTGSPEPSEKTSSKKSKEVAAATAKGKRDIKATTTTSKARKISEVKEESSQSEGDDEECDEEQSEEGEEEELSFSESDDDNDMDFNVNDRFGKNRPKKKRKYRHRQKQKSMTIKDILEGNADLNSVDDEPKKKYGKVSKKSITPSRPSTANTSKNQINQSQKKVIQSKNSQQTIKKEFTPSSTFKAAATISSSVPVTAKTSTEKEIVESIAKDLEKSYTESNPSSPIKKPIETIPTIMQILETNTSAEILDQSLSSLEHMDTADAATSIEEINDALIAALGTETLDELLKQGDLMNFDGTQNTSATIIKTIPSLPASIPSSDSSVLTISPSSTLQSSPKILNKQAPQKDPIKIVKNGRVITLPPIEAPATRGAKKRAQGDPVTPVSTPVVSTSPVSVISKVVKTEKVIKENSDSRNSSRRSSLNKSESGGRNSRRQSTTAHEEKDEDANSDATWNSEDDPDRLWCICKQPHSNRFMICCDKCEDWFHGTCVNITKTQGKNMEEKNIKWLCPNCKTGGAIKKDPNKKPLNQQKLTKFFSKHQKESTDDESGNLCVVCKKKPVRTDSIYCSDECIQNQATKHIDSPSSQDKKTEGKSGNILKDQEGKVIVYDRTNGKLLSSKLWPHMNNLKAWLVQNPNCEIVRPGSTQADQLMTTLSNKKQHAASLQTPTISSTTTVKQEQVDDLFSNPVKINTGNNPTTPTTPTSQKEVMKKYSTKINLKSPKATVVSSSSTPQSHKSVSKPHEEKKLKRQHSDEKPPSVSSSGVKAKVDMERQNVRNNFKSTLANRMKDFEHPTIAKMTDEEVEKFAKNLELEMFLHFNKDTKDKYKNKFRSLKFNLSDVKNKTLLEKICARTLSPQQLVTLPPSELASEELAKWREDEEKHQLEIITKSELDAMNSQNKIIVKTRKGEEIIETKTTSADILVPGPEEDIESAISKSILSVDDGHGKHDKSISLNISGHSVTSPLSSPSISSSTSRSKSEHRRSRSRSKSREHHHHHHHHKSSSSSSKHKRRSRSKSPKHHHHHHHSSSSHSRDKSRDKSHSRDRSKHRDRHHEKHHRDKSKSNEKDKSTSSSAIKAKEKDTRNDSSKKNSHQQRGSSKEKQVKKREIEPEQEDVDLVGKILDSMGVHLDPKPIAKTAETSSEVASTDPITAEETPASTISLEPINEHQLEIEIYSGSMYMADVAKFDVTASIVSGNVDDVVKKLPSTMEIVGRINPSTVWEYLDKMKKYGREIALLRFASTDESAYFSLFSYLNTRQRYGVIKSPHQSIKDFYLITVEANRSLPSVLLPIVGPGFIEGEDHKPDLLLGVVLKMGTDLKQVKKSAKDVVKKKSSKHSVEHNVPIQMLPTKHKSPHQSTSSGSKLIMGLPEIKSDDIKKSSTSPMEGDDEPYEPFDDDDEAFSSQPPATATKLNASDDLESQVELLNRQIEERQMEIQRLAQQKAMELDEEQASRIYEQISVPHNLSEILSTIKASSENPKPMDIDDDDDDDFEYVPIPSVANTNQSNLEYRPATTTTATASNFPPIVNSMMDIDERINLFHAQEMQQQQQQEQPSRLATMSDADLMKLVPDDAFEAPPAPIISSNNEPPIPGLEYDDMEN